MGPSGLRLDGASPLPLQDLGSMVLSMLPMLLFFLMAAHRRNPYLKESQRLLKGFKKLQPYSPSFRKPPFLKSNHAIRSWIGPVIPHEFTQLKPTTATQNYDQWSQVFGLASFPKAPYFQIIVDQDQTMDLTIPPLGYPVNIRVREGCKLILVDSRQSCQTSWLRIEVESGGQVDHLVLNSRDTAGYQHVGVHCSPNSQYNLLSIVHPHQDIKLVDRVEIYQEAYSEVRAFTLANLPADNHYCLQSLIRVGPHCQTVQKAFSVCEDVAKLSLLANLIVDQEAQHSDSQQLLKTLVMGDNRVICQPRLEIEADQVKCAHGAAISQADPNSLKYMRSRGLGLETSQQLLAQSTLQGLLDEFNFQTHGQSAHDLLFRENP